MKDGNYIITAAQLSAAPHSALLKNLENCAKARKAQIIVVPISGCYKDDSELHQDLKNRYQVLTKDLKLNSNIKVCNEEVRPQQTDPTTGLGRFAQDDCSTIFGSPKQRMKVLPNSNVDLPKILMTTGCCTMPYYKEHTRIGRIAKRDHVFGAVLVEIKDNTFYQYRHLTANASGSFYDLGTYYHDGRVLNKKPEALILGDWHTRQVCPVIREEVFRMLKRYKPKRVFFHDFFDAKSISHHEDGKLIDKHNTMVGFGLSLEDELYELACEIKTFAEDFKDIEFVIVKSNHDTHLDRYLNEGRFIKEPQNLYLGAKLLVEVLDGKDPIVAGISQFYDIPKNVRFLTRDEDYRVYGWNLANHGDLTFNGAKGGLQALEAANGKAVIGHRHTPEIFRNIYIVGTSTPLKLSYNSGYSSWMNTSCFVYDNGKAQLFNIINGEHRYE